MRVGGRWGVVAVQDGGGDGCCFPGLGVELVEVVVVGVVGGGEGAAVVRGFVFFVGGVGGVVEVAFGIDGGVGLTVNG